MMTVEELIEELRKYPADMKLLVRSYELGYDPIKKLELMNLTPNPTDHEYEGNMITWDHREFLASSKKDGWGFETIEINESDQKARFEGLVLVGDSRSSY